MWSKAYCITCGGCISHIAPGSFRHRKQIRIQLPFSCRFFTATEYILFYFLIHLLSNVKDICNISKTYCITGGGADRILLQMLPATEYKSEYSCLLCQLFLEFLYHHRIQIQMIFDTEYIQLPTINFKITNLTSVKVCTCANFQSLIESFWTTLLVKCEPLQNWGVGHFWTLKNCVLGY